MAAVGGLGLFGAGEAHPPHAPGSHPGALDPAGQRTWNLGTSSDITHTAWRVLPVASTASRIASATRFALAMMAATATAHGHSFDHLACFPVHDLRDRQAGQDVLAVAPDLAPALPVLAGCRVKGRARRLCVESAVSAVPPPAPQTSTDATDGRIYLCYAMRCPRADSVALELRDSFASGPVITRSGRTKRDLCVPATPAVSTTTVTDTMVTTSTTPLPTCTGIVEIDPAGVIGALSAGLPANIPVAASAVIGVLDVFLEDGGAGGAVACPPTGCLMGVTGNATVVFTYVAPAGVDTVELTARLSPHSPGFTCGPGSSGSVSGRVFAVGP